MASAPGETSKLGPRDTVYHALRLSREDMKRLTHHTRRLGCSVTVLVQLTVHDRLNRLDEEEALSKHHQAMAKSRTLAKGLGLEGFLRVPERKPNGNETALSQKERRLEDSFPRYAQYVEEVGLGEIDQKLRMKEVRDELKQRAPEGDLGDRLYFRFEEFLRTRRTQLKTRKTIEIPEPDEQEETREGGDE